MILFKKQITIISSFFINKSYFLYNIVQKHLKYNKRKNILKNICKCINIAMASNSVDLWKKGNTPCSFSQTEI